MIKPEVLDKPIKSFVLRSGRMTEGQRLAFEHHWETYGLSISEGFINAELIFGRTAPVVVARKTRGTGEVHLFHLLYREAPGL